MPREKRGREETPTSFPDKHKSLLTELEAALSDPSQKSLCAPLLIRARAAARSAYRDVERAKLAANDACAALDGAILALKNVTYESQHYQREIATAHSVQFDASSLNLAELDVVRAERPDLLVSADALEANLPNVDPESRASAEADHAHLIMLARLTHELDSRRALSQRLSKVSQDVVSMQAKNAALEGFLGGLPAAVQAVAKAAAPLQERLQVPHAVRSGDERRLAALLPAPLYALMVQAKAFAEAHDHCVRVEMEQQDVRLYFRVGDGEIPVRFSLVADMGIVGVTVLNDNGSEAPEQAQAVLVNVFPGDAGTVSPNAAHAFGEFANTRFEGKVRPYRWAQWLSGLDFAPTSHEEAVTHPTVATVLKAVAERLAGRKALAEQMKSLKRLIVPKVDADGPPPPIVVSSRLTQCVDISASDFEDMAGLVEPEFTMFCRLTLQQTTGRLSAAIAIPADYPARAPRFSLSIPGDAGSGGVRIAALRKACDPAALAASDEAAKSIEPSRGLLNAMTIELQKLESHEGDAFLLSRQVRRLCELWEIASQVAKRGDAFGTGGRFCTRAKRGRERRPPFLFNSALQLFDHHV